MECELTDYINSIENSSDRITTICNLIKHLSTLLPTDSEQKYQSIINVFDKIIKNETGILQCSNVFRAFCAMYKETYTACRTGAYIQVKIISKAPDKSKVKPFDNRELKKVNKDPNNYHGSYICFKTGEFIYRSAEDPVKLKSIKLSPEAIQVLKETKISDQYIYNMSSLTFTNEIAKYLKKFFSEYLPADKYCINELRKAMP